MQLVVGVARATPRWATPAVAAVLRTLTRPFARKDDARLRDNVHRIFRLPPGTHFARMFQKQTQRHQMRCALETLQAIHDPSLVTVLGFDELAARIKTCESRGKPVIIVTAHLGSWELCAYYAQKASSKPLNVLAKPSRVPAATRALDELRQRMGAKVIWTGSKTLVREMLGALRRGEALGFVADQKPEGRQGPVVSFFGIPTAFVGGPATMALKVDASIVSIFCVREGPYRYRLVSETLHEGGASDETTLTQRMAQSIERAIRLYPEQWTWTYKRWRFDQQVS